LFDVERGAEPLLRGGNVGLGEADTKLRRRVGRAVGRRRQRGDVRVAPASQRVENQPNPHEQQRIQQHGHERKAIARVAHGRASNHRRQRDCARGRMQAAKEAGERDRASDGQGCGAREIWNRAGRGHAHQRRDEVPPDHRPGLREWARRHAKDEHGRRPDGRDQERHLGIRTQPGAHHESGGE